MKRILLKLQPLAPFSIATHRERHVAGTLDHFPGSTVRGGLATAWIRHHGRDEAFEGLFVSGKVRFPFCYPGSGGERPAPITARQCKTHQPPGGHPLQDAALRLVSPAEDSLGSQCPAPGCDARLVRYHGFITRGGNPSPVVPRRETRMHVAISSTSGTADPGRLFGIEVVVPRVKEGSSGVDLQLNGHLYGDDEALDTLRREFEQRTIWLGRSRSHGLGECRVAFEDSRDPSASLCERLERWRTASTALPGQGLPVVLTLISPAILVDDQLRYHFDMVAELKGRLRLSEAVCFVERKEVFGWNIAGRLPKTVDLAIDAGGVMLGRSALPRAELIEAMEALESQGIGQRRNEGYGGLLGWDPFLLGGN